jgi:hypothetical protein
VGFTYSITDSSNNLNTVDGRRVASLHRQMIGICSTFYVGLIGAVRHDVAVTTPGSVSLPFSLAPGGPYIAAVYIDIDGSRNLSNGDKVWGTNPSDSDGLCYEHTDAMPSTIAFDWGAFPTGTTTWAGGSQPLAATGRADAGFSRYFRMDGGGADW